MWDIGSLYQQAWQIIKKHKFLWIFGIAAGGGSSLNFRSMQNFQPGKMQGFDKLFDQPHTSESVKNVLGASTAATPSILSLLSQVPIYLYILLALEIIIFMVIAIIISVLYKAWATGLLLEGVESGINNEEIALEHISQKAFSHLKPLVWLQIVPWLFFAIGSVLYITLVTVILFFFQKLIILGILLTLVGFVLALAIMVRLTISMIWAPRLVITKHLGGSEALRQGYALGKNRFWQMILLGIVNLVTGTIVMILPFAALAIIILPIILLINKDTMNIFIALIPVAALLGIGIIFGLSLLGGIINAFKATVWSLAYRTIIHE